MKIRTLRRLPHYGVLVLCIAFFLIGSGLSSYNSSESLDSAAKEIYHMEDVIYDCGYSLSRANETIGELNDTVKIANNIDEYKAWHYSGAKFRYGDKVSTSTCKYGDWNGNY